MLLDISPEIINLSPGSAVILHHQTWEDYEQLLNRRQDKAAIKIRYQAQTQDLENRTAILGKERIDLALDPPPDLAIEVDLTCGTKAEDYLPFAVPEL